MSKVVIYITNNNVLTFLFKEGEIVSFKRTAKLSLFLLVN